MASVKFGGVNLRIGGGVAYTLSQNVDGSLILTLVKTDDTRKPKPVACRLVVLDAARKRYLPYTNAAGGATNLAVEICRLDAKDLPIEKIRYIGIEQLTDKGRKAIIARAQERARKAGIDILPPSRIGEVYDFALTTLDGKRIHGRDLHGKVVLIDCWSTGCTPCMEKMPKLKQLYDKRHKDGFEIIGVALEKDAETVEKFCAKKGLTWPQVLVPTDDKTREMWYEASGLTGVPRLLVIDRQGILRADCGPNELEKEITKVLDQSAERSADPKK